jgi:hypothetical protein
MAYTHSDGLDEADTMGRTRRMDGGRGGWREGGREGWLTVLSYRGASFVFPLDAVLEVGEEAFDTHPSFPPFLPSPSFQP